MTIAMMTTATIAALTGNTINAKPRHLAGFVLLLVALKHQFAFPRRFFVKEIAFAVEGG